MKWTFIYLLFISCCLQAQVYEFNTTQLGQWNGAGEVYSDIWGYSAGGKEFAILGSARFIYFFNVTDPANIQLVNKFGPFTSTSWREFKTYGHYAYAVTDGPDAGGLRIFDLQYLPDSVIQVRQTTAFFTKCHMTFIDEPNGRLYCAGTNTQNGGIIVLDLAVRPDSPTVVINQPLPRGYVHDIYVKNNVMYASHIYSGYLSQYNCAGNSCSGELSAYQTTGYNHSSWMNSDQTLMINAIETAGHPLWLFPIAADGKIGTENIKKFKSVTLRDQYINQPVGDTGSIGHNPYIIGNLAYVSYYTDGVQIYDLSNINNVRRIAYFDTDRGYTSYSPVFRGCWGTYPFLPSGNILASDIQSGLWIFKTTPCAVSQLPSVSISSTASSYIRNTSFIINAMASDPDGTPTKVEFYNGTTLLGTDLSAPFEFTVNPASASNYTLTGKVFDDCGHSTTSSILSITTTVSCSDGVQNGTETGVDCGGSCGVCISCPGDYNISQGKIAIQSSNFDANNTYPASRAFDGNNTNFQHTGMELQPWLEIDLGSSHTVNSIEIRHRTDCAPCGGRIKKFKVFLTNTPVNAYSNSGFVYEYNNPIGLANGEILNIPAINGQGRYVRIWADFVSPGFLHLAEVNVMGCSGGNLCTNNQVPTNVNITSNTASYPQNSSFIVTSTANDVGGTINRIEFYNGNTLLGYDFSSPYTYTINPAAASAYAITAKAIDNCGGETSSSVLNITTTSTCNDGIKNGTETGVDCGSGVVNCPNCAVGCTTSVLISQGKSASQSSNFDAGNTFPASRAVDGNNTNFQHTGSEVQPWFEIDLGSTHVVNTIEIRHRTDCPSCSGRIKKFRVFVANSQPTLYSNSGFVYEYNNPVGLSNGELLNIAVNNIQGRYVRIWGDYATTGFLHFAEVKVMGCVGNNSCANNQAPTNVNLTSPANTYPQNSSFDVTASASDVDGTISRIEFYNGNALLGTDFSSPYSFTISPASASTYSITAKAIDNCGGEALSANLNIVTTNSCSDGIKNGTESGIDCGSGVGNCPTCPPVCSTSVLISQGKIASQSSNFDAVNTYPAGRAVDGNNTNFQHTGSQLQPWLEIDLGNTQTVSGIEIRHRSGCAQCSGRTKKFRIFVTNTQVTSYSSAGFVFEYNNPVGLANGEILNINAINTPGRYVRIWADNVNPDFLHLAEVKVMGCTISASAVLTNSTTKEDLKDPLTINLYPNPASDELTFSSNKKLKDYTITILDLFGKQVRVPREQGKNKVYINYLMPGTYIFKMESEGEIMYKKFIKM